MKVKFFQTARGAYPVRDFIDGLEKITQAKVAKYIGLLINYGPYLRPPYIKKKLVISTNSNQNITS